MKKARKSWVRFVAAAVLTIGLAITASGCCNLDGELCDEDGDCCSDCCILGICVAEEGCM